MKTTYQLANGDVLALSINNSSFGQDSNLNDRYTITDLMQMIESQVGAPRYRIYVLYPDETINFEIPLSDIVEGGSYSENYQDGQRRSLSFQLYNDQGKYTPNINMFWAGTRLRLDFGVESFDGTTIWVQKGVFVVAKASVTQSQGEETVSIEASDKFALFENKTGTLEMTYEVPVGMLIQDAIEGILRYDVGNSYPLDSRGIIYHSSFKGKRTQASISKSAGETLGSILIELATQLSAEIFYNSQGILTLIPTSETTTDQDKPLLANVTGTRGDYNKLSFDFDMTSIINRVIVTGTSNTSNGVFKAVAVNDDPASPLCCQRIGYRTGNVINDSNITSNYLAEERAKYELRKQLILKSSTSLDIAFNPLLTVNSLVAINNTFFEMINQRFLIQSVSCSLDYGGTMSISLSNLANLPFIN